MSQLLQNAAYGTVMILAVAGLRRVLRERLVPEARLALWAVCLFRLLTPAAPESVLSLWGLSRLFAARTQTAPSAPAPQLYIPAAPAPAPQPDPGISWETVLAVLWLAVGLALAARYVLVWTRTRRAVSCAIPLDRSDRRYSPLPKCARLREGPMEGAPLTFGAVRPIVVLSPGLDGPELDCVLAHEGVHAQRRDNLWHYVTALALAIHWWNPAVWLMSRLLRRDIELSCDRAALNRLGEDRRVDYAQALVSLAAQGSDPDFCQTFGRKAVEERIRSIMKFKKTSIIGVIFSLTLVLAVTAAFASEPKEPQNDTIEFMGQTFSRDQFSQETLDWMDWYLSLSDDERRTVSDDFPAELEDAFTSSAAAVKIIPNPEKTAALQSDYPTVDPDDVDLEMLKARLAQRVADGELTQEDADTELSVIEGMLEQARRGELKLFLYEDGNIFGGAVFTVNGQDETYFTDYDLSNSTTMSLSEFQAGLALRVKDGRLTQAEADQRINSLLDLMGVKSLDELKLPSEDALAIVVYEEDFTTGGYAAYADIGLPRHYYTEDDEDVVQGVLVGQGTICYDGGDPVTTYNVSLPTFDEDGNSVSADGGIIGTRDFFYVTLDEYKTLLDSLVAGGKMTRSEADEMYAGAKKDLERYGDGTSGAIITNESGGYSIMPAPNTAYPVCTVSGCPLEGLHEHNGVTYCGGAGHHGSTCDGACVYCAQQSVASGAHHSESHHTSGHHADGHH